MTELYKRYIILNSLLGGCAQDTSSCCSRMAAYMRHLPHTVKGSSFATGLEIQDKRRRVLMISTGSKAVDTILGGECMPAFVFTAHLTSAT